MTAKIGQFARYKLLGDFLKWLKLIRGITVYEENTAELAVDNYGVVVGYSSVGHIGRVSPL
jgi:hypothetical protein